VDTDDSSERFKTYLSDTLTAYPTNQHPLMRAIHGEVIDGAEIFLRQSDSSEGLWLAATGRPLIDEHGPVSYTHLDVYKRQLLFWSDTAGRSLILRCGFRN